MKRGVRLIGDEDTHAEDFGLALLQLSRKERNDAVQTVAVGIDFPEAFRDEALEAYQCRLE